MRKENLLVAVLVVLVLGGGYLYFRIIPDSGAQATAAPGVANDKAVQNSSIALASASSGEIAWSTYSKGMAQARAEKKNVFLYFHASWCGYCVKLKKETFTDERVKTFLNDHFVSIGVDTETHKKLARQWGVRGLPTLWFLEPDGTKINSLPGFVSADQLLSILQYIHTRSYKTMSYQDYLQQQ